MHKLLPIKDVKSEYKWSPKPEPSIYGTAIGAWGDVILDLAAFKTNIGHGGIILFTKDAALVDFARQQTFIDRVEWVKPVNEDDYFDMYQKACSTWAYEDVFPFAEIANRTSLDLSKIRIVQTHLRPERRGLIPWHGARLPYNAWRWAYEQSQWLPHNYYVLHPYSIHSCPLDGHWRLWEGAIEYLLNYTPHTYVLTGTEWQTDFTHPRLVNLVGASDTMMDIFALSEMSKGVITTSNGLSHYAVVQNLPAVVCGNIPLSLHESPFREFLQADNINLLYYEEGLAKFVNLVNKIV